MSIIEPSNYTRRIGVWVNSKNVRGKSSSLVYCTIPLIAMQGYHTNVIADASAVGTYLHVLVQYWVLFVLVYIPGIFLFGDMYIRARFTVV